jgi:hypothetical protein
MRKLTFILSLTLPLPLLLPGCGGDDGVAEENVEGDGDGDGDGDGETTAEGDGDGDGDTAGDGDGDTAGDGDGDGDTAGDGDGDTEGDGDGDTAGDGDGDGDGDGEATGYCAASCRADEDCCPLGAINCPGDNYPDNYFCSDQGVCEFGGCSNDDDCNTGGPLTNQECHAIEGLPTCFEPCATDSDCILQPGTTCSGLSDDGVSYCAPEAAPGCRNDDDCAGNGICDVDTGECYCQQDSNCTAEGVDTCVLN